MGFDGEGGMSRAWADPPEAPHALVLSGGAGNAAYEAGVMQALAGSECAVTGYRPLDPLILSGTSAGAFHAALIASWPEYPFSSIADYLVELWRNRIADGPQTCGNGVYRFRGDPRPIFDSRCQSKREREFVELLQDTASIGSEAVDRIDYLSGEQTTAVGKILQFLDLSTFVSSYPFRSLLASTLRPAAIRASNRLLRIAVTQWSKGTVQIFSNVDMTDEQTDLIVSASAAIPGFFPPVVLDGEYYVDGGVVMDTPLLPAIEAGAQVLHVIYQDSNVATIPFEKFRSFLSAFDRMYAIMKARVLDQDIEVARRVNVGLNLLEDLERGTIGVPRPYRSILSAAGSLLDPQNAGRQPYRKLTIHRYQPRQDLGGVSGLLNFQLDRVESLIRMGYQDAVHHDCHEAECVLPGGEADPPRQKAAQARARL
jgi:predicted acylesterase/phospholipase RssA